MEAENPTSWEPSGDQATKVTTEGTTVMAEDAAEAIISMTQAAADKYEAMATEMMTTDAAQVKTQPTTQITAGKNIGPTPPS